MKTQFQFQKNFKLKVMFKKNKILISTILKNFLKMHVK